MIAQFHLQAGSWRFRRTKRLGQNTKRWHFALEFKEFTRQHMLLAIFRFHSDGCLISQRDSQKFKSITDFASNWPNKVKLNIYSAIVWWPGWERCAMKNIGMQDMLIKHSRLLCSFCFNWPRSSCIWRNCVVDLWLDLPNSWTNSWRHLLISFLCLSINETTKITFPPPMVPFTPTILTAT